MKVASVFCNWRYSDVNIYCEKFGIGVFFFLLYTLGWKFPSARAVNKLFPFAKHKFDYPKN
jgi:hypothetical protein